MIADLKARRPQELIVGIGLRVPAISSELRKRNSVSREIVMVYP
jgi:hypothetical protein